MRTSDGHELYYEVHGEGPAAVYLHGGPGAGFSKGAYKLLPHHRAVFYDQRGCGRSPGALSTTQRLVQDLEELREHLGIQQWTVLGVSWGSTLAQAYAHRHPQRVSQLILALVTTTSREEVEWMTEGVGKIFPREHERFARDYPRPLIDHYYRMLQGPDQEQARRQWCDWEESHISLAPDYQRTPFTVDPLHVVHYWKHHAFLEPNELLDHAANLTGIPGTLIHGRYDVSLPLRPPYEISKRWKTSRLHVVEDMGHGNGTSFIQAILAAQART